MPTVVKISALSKVYEGGHKARNSSDLDIEEGEILALLGPNGAGKTTLISIILADIVDVRIKRADFPSGVAASVFDRMRAERERIASAQRAEGAQIDLEKRAEVDRIVQIITQTAQGDAARIIGEAEGQAISILAEQLGRDPEFYAFIRSLEAYKVLLENDATLILNVNSDLWRYLESPLPPADR
mgnify:CR=1 FL=1